MRLLEAEDLHEVVLCAASYGGMPATGAAQEVSARIRLLVYVDGLVPLTGRAAVDLFPMWFAELVHDGLAEHGPAWRVPMPSRLAEALVPRGSVPDDVRREYLGRIRSHPATSFVESLQLTPDWDSVPKAFVRCTTTSWAEEVEGDPVAAGAARARQAGWAVPRDRRSARPSALRPSGHRPAVDGAGSSAVTRTRPTAFGGARSQGATTSGEAGGSDAAFGDNDLL